jgi:putative serine protease PepD
VATGRDDATLVLGGAAALRGTVAGFSGRAEVRVQGVLPPHQTLAAPVVDGRFAVTGLVPGDYVVTAQAPGELATASVSLAAGAGATVELRSRGSGTLTGAVVELGSGAPVAGALCRLLPFAGETVIVGAAQPGAETRSDARGAFGFAAPAGALRVTCFAVGHTTGSAVVSVEAGSTTTVEVALVALRPVADPGFTLDLWSVPARILEVVDGGPAALAGLRPGDVITAVGGAPVAGLDRMAVGMLIAGHPAGTVVEVTTSRGATRLTLR